MTYLNKEKLTEELNKTPMIAQHIDCMDLFDAINIATVENVAEVVRCKDCKAWKQYDDMNLGECELFPEYNKMGDWFCNFGERHEGR